MVTNPPINGSIWSLLSYLWVILSHHFLSKNVHVILVKKQAAISKFKQENC